MSVLILVSALVLEGVGVAADIGKLTHAHKKGRLQGRVSVSRVAGGWGLAYRTSFLGTELAH